MKRQEKGVHLSIVKERGCQRAIKLYFHPSEPKLAAFLKGKHQAKVVKCIIKQAAACFTFRVPLSYTFLYGFNFVPHHHFIQYQITLDVCSISQ